MSIYYMPGTVLSAWDIDMDEADKSLPLWVLYSSKERQSINKSKINNYTYIKIFDKYHGKTEKVEQGKGWDCNFKQYGQNRAHIQKMMEQRLEESKRIQEGILVKNIQCIGNRQ